MKKLALIAALILTPAFAEACKVGPNWEAETMQKSDKNSDGKISLEEFFANQHGLTTEQKQNNWEAISKTENDHLTRQEFLSAVRPKCIGN